MHYSQSIVHLTTIPGDLRSELTFTQLVVEADGAEELGSDNGGYSCTLQTDHQSMLFIQNLPLEFQCDLTSSHVTSSLPLRRT